MRKKETVILTIGGTKGGTGKTTLAINLTIARCRSGKDVLLVDGDEQKSSYFFTGIRNETKEAEGGAGYTCIPLTGGRELRKQVLELSPKFDDVIIDVGGFDNQAQRGALTVCDLALFPFKPRTFDIWTIETVENLVKEASVVNDKIEAFSVLNQGDSYGRDNNEAEEYLKESKEITFLPCSIQNRKAFSHSAKEGLSVFEMRNKDKKAIAEVEALHTAIFLSTAQLAAL